MRAGEEAVGRHGHLDRAPLEARSNEAALPSPIDACAAIATQRGTMRTLAEESKAGRLTTTAAGEAMKSEGPRREASAIEHGGFNLHASVRISADDDLGRERLCRYCARPAFSLDRFRVLAGGRVAYRTKKLGAGRAKHRVMTPLELLARLAALVPPPRYPLVRYHGVLAPHAAWRREIVPRPPTDVRSRHVAAAHAESERARAKSARADAWPGERSHRREARDGRQGRAEESASTDAASRRRTGSAIGAAAIESVAAVAPGRGEPARAEAGAEVGAEGVTRLTPNVLSVRHWSPLLGGVLYAPSRRVRSSELLRRTFDVTAFGVG